MIVSTKGRYALRVMLELARYENEGYISLKSIAERQNISMKYLESIVSTLTKASYVRSMRGKEGGYCLSRPASSYTIGSILKLTEGSLSPVSCIECGQSICEKADSCLTLPIWKHLDTMIDKYLESVTLEDLLKQKIAAD